MKTYIFFMFVHFKIT